MDANSLREVVVNVLMKKGGKNCYQFLVEEQKTVGRTDRTPATYASAPRGACAPF